MHIFTHVARAWADFGEHVRRLSRPALKATLGCMVGFTGLVAAESVGFGAGTVALAVPTTHQPVPTMQTILTAAKAAHLTDLLVPVKADLVHKVESVECDDNQVFTIDFPKLVVRESMHPLSIDTPSDQRKLGQVGASEAVVWQSFMLPDDGVQHVMSLKLHGVYVLLIPKSLDAPNDLNDLATMTNLAKTLKAVHVAT